MKPKRNFALRIIIIVVIVVGAGWFYWQSDTYRSAQYLKSFGLYGTHFTKQSRSFLCADLNIYVHDHGENYPYPTTGKRGLVDVMAALSGETIPTRIASTIVMVTYRNKSQEAWTEFIKTGTVSPDKFFFTYVDGLTPMDRGILMFYNQSTFARIEFPDSPKTEGRLVIRTGDHEPVFLPEAQFQAELAATRRLLDGRAKERAKDVKIDP
jgi:hypothetical protein